MRSVWILSAWALLGASGCATTAGFGRDVETAGVAIQRGVAQNRAPAPTPTVTPDADVYVAPIPGQ
jgi:predicted small secreted protein